MTASVFVSHSSRDAVKVRALVAALEARGIVCWISERDIAAGDNYGDSIVDAIERAGAMLLVFSNNANDSDEIKKEVALASQRRITVVPVRLEDVTPSKAFRYELATRNWIDLFPDQSAGLARLRDRLAGILELGVAPVPPPPAPSPRPASAAPRSRSNLLYILSGIAGLVALAGVAWILLHTPNPPPAPAPTLSPTVSLSPTIVATASLSPTPSPTASPSVSPTPTATPAPTPTPSSSPTPSPLETVPATPSVTPTASPRPPSPSPSPTAAPTATISPSPTVTPSPSATPTPAPTATPSTQASATPQPTAAGVAIGPPPKIAADDPGGELFKECEDCPEMTIVPAGKATLGSPLGEGGRQKFEMAPHEVDIAQPFAVARYAITFQEWDACFAEGGCGHRKLSDLDFGRGRRPAIFVTWNDAELYVDWLKRKTGQPYRLLSEAEWEYAARGCASLKCPYAPFWFGAITPELAVYDWRQSYQGSPKATPPLATSPVDAGRANSFGLYNMLGNVRQWTLDCWNASPPSAPSDGAPATSGDCSERAIRGGSWADKPADLRAAARSWESVDEGSEKTGFRVARPLTP